MKEYGGLKPVIVLGGAARDFLGEYMARGRIVMLNLEGDPREAVDCYLGTGMHGGKIYVHGEVAEWQLGIGARLSELSDEDWAELQGILREYSSDMDLDLSDLKRGDLVKVSPLSHRPYGKMYALE